MSNINSNTREVLKNIPSVDQIVLHCNNKYKIEFPYPLLKKIISNQVSLIRNEMRSGLIKGNNIKDILYKRIDSDIKYYSSSSLKSVINGTGIVLHTGLGRAPINKKILNQAIDNIYPYSNLEYNLIDNTRGERNNHLSYLINALSSSQSSIIVNNNAAAVLLVLNTLSENKEVIISRGELVEIGGSFRIPDVIKKAHCKMIEIGTTNKTHLKDFKNAINENTGLIMIAHTSNYKVVGFTESVDVKDIVQIAKKNRIPLFLDLGSGALINYEKHNLPKEKILQKYIRMGIDIISFSGDKLLGGPQSGIICGKKTLINKIHSNSMYRALRCDKLTISLMEATLRTYINENTVNDKNLTFKLLVRSRKELEKIGKNILKTLNKKIIKQYNITLISSTVQAGSGSLPIENIESMALVFNSENSKPSKISKLLRNSCIPTIGYIKGNKFYIDLKAISKGQIKKLVKSIEHCLV